METIASSAASKLASVGGPPNEGLGQCCCNVLLHEHRSFGDAIGISVVCMSGSHGTMARLRPDGQVVRHATATRLSPVRFRLGPLEHPSLETHWGTYGSVAKLVKAPDS